MMVILFFCVVRIVYYLLLYINFICYCYYFFVVLLNINGEIGVVIVKREVVYNMNSLMNKGDEFVINLLIL